MLTQAIEIARRRMRRSRKAAQGEVRCVPVVDSLASWLTSQSRSGGVSQVAWEGRSVR